MQEYWPLFIKTRALREWSGAYNTPQHQQARILLPPLKKEGLALCKRLRTKFCRNITRTRLGPGFRTHSINLYLDRMGFVYKKN